MYYIQHLARGYGILFRLYETCSSFSHSADGQVAVYVAAVWNSYRKTRLKLLDLAAECIDRLRDYDRTLMREIDLNLLEKKSEQVAKSIAASVPYHLIADFPQLIRQLPTVPERVAPGKSVGGLLLMHPIYVASTASLLSPQLRGWMRQQLRWIGEKMGISQATLLANVRFGHDCNPEMVY